MSAYSIAHACTCCTHSERPDRDRIRTDLANNRRPSDDLVSRTEFLPCTAIRKRRLRGTSGASSSSRESKRKDSYMCVKVCESVNKNYLRTNARENREQTQKEEEDSLLVQ